MHTSTLALLRSSASSSDDDWRSSKAFATKRSDRFQGSAHDESRLATARPRTTNARKITTGSRRSLLSCFAHACDAAAPPTLKTSCKNSSVALFGPCCPPRCFAAASNDVDPRKSLSNKFTPFCARYCSAATFPLEAADWARVFPRARPRDRKSAPCFARTSRHFTLGVWTAVLTADRPRLFLRCIEAPCFRKKVTSLSWPQWQATCKGLKSVSPVGHSRSAPSRSSCFAAAMLPNRAALVNSVSPLEHNCLGALLFNASASNFASSRRAQTAPGPNAESARKVMVQRSSGSSAAMALFVRRRCCLFCENALRRCFWAGVVPTI